MWQACGALLRGGDVAARIPSNNVLTHSDAKVEHCDYSKSHRQRSANGLQHLRQERGGCSWEMRSLGS